MNEGTFDIFSGVPEEHGVFVEAVEGLSNAQQRMGQIAAQEPGKYGCPHGEDSFKRHKVPRRAFITSRITTSRISNAPTIAPNMSLFPLSVKLERDSLSTYKEMPHKKHYSY